MRRVATDVGGTFTDLVYQDFDEATGAADDVHAVKVSTTPPDFDRGVIDAVVRAGIDPATMDFFAHGTTVVINALLSRRGAKVGLITTRGFRDVLEIARGNRPDLFNYAFAKPEPFVPRYLRREVTERLDPKGGVVERVRLDELDAIVADFRAEGVEAVAVCLLHAFVNPDHEIAVHDHVRALWPEVSVIASHRISREWREYERTNTTVLSAYVHPATRSYLDRLADRLRDNGFAHQPYIMQSNGGISTIAAARANPVSIVESGPASGMLGAAAIGRQIGERNIIALDIGGTTAKCSLIEGGAPTVTTSYFIEKSRTNPGYPILTPVIDIVEIGNGGGSIAWLDDAGALRVGPQSAGALPGPAAYGRGGTLPTITDANLLLGKIDPDNFVGGEMQPDMGALNRAMDDVAGRLGCGRIELARGILRIANANMVNALKLVSVNRGYDPRDFCLLAFGGGGALHAADLAAELGIPKVIIPRNSAVFSAWGMLMTDLRRDYVRTALTVVEDGTAAMLESRFVQLTGEAEHDLEADGIPADRRIIERRADMRYRGQEHTVKVGVPGGTLDGAALVAMIDRFHDAHHRSYGFRLPYPVEIVNYHLTAWGTVPKSALPGLPDGPSGGDPQPIHYRLVDFDGHGRCERTPVYDRATLPHGVSLTGPALVQEPSTVTTLLPGQRLEMDAFGNLIIHCNAGN